MALFISLEGPDGSGKSTQARLLGDALRDRGLPVFSTHEPGGTRLGDQVRRIALDHHDAEISPVAMALLMSVSRAQLVQEVIEPALAGGAIVIADRYADSTVAYQSFGMGVPREVVRDLTRIATGGRQPDLTVYVAVPPEVGLGRIGGRGPANRLDAETLAFHRRVQKGYEQLIAEEPQRWIVVDGTRSPEEVHLAIMDAIEPRLGEGAAGP